MEVCTTIYSYNGAGGDEVTTLTFEAGETVSLLFDGEGGWWEGEKDGKRGWFPASYVTKCNGEINDTDELWKEVSTIDGETYYVNTKTNETSWEIPKQQTHTESMNKTSNNGVANGLHLDLHKAHSEDNILKSQVLSSIPKLQINTPDSEPTTPKSTQSLPCVLSKTPQNNSPQTRSSRSSPRSLRSPKMSASSMSINGGSVSPKPRVRIVNGISFPNDIEAKEQNLLQPGKFSYCDYFWSDQVDSHNFHSGFFILYQKALKGKQVCKEMAELLKAREALEIQYAKGLAAIANGTQALQACGTLGDSWKEMKETTMQESKLHLQFANQIRTQVEKPLIEEKEREKKELKKLEASISDLRKQVLLKYQSAERSKQLLNERNRDLDNKMNSPKHTKDDVQKARRKSVKQSEELTHSVEAYNHVRQQWFEDMVTSSLVLEKHEVDRIEAVKTAFTKYQTLNKDAADKTKKVYEGLEQHITSIDAHKDREIWVRKNATGKIKPVDLVL